MFGRLSPSLAAVEASWVFFNGVTGGAIQYLWTAKDYVGIGDGASLLPKAVKVAHSALN